MASTRCKWFTDHNEKILGEVLTRKDRYGKNETYVSGDASKLDKINIAPATEAIEPLTPAPKPVEAKVVKAKKPVVAKPYSFVIRTPTEPMTFD